MKILTVLGTRPEIIRLSRVISLLDHHAAHILVHTGQNYDTRLSQVFFDELGVRPPDEYLSVQAPSFAAQIGQILERSEILLRKHRPDRVVILGDTDSGMAAIVARRLGIPVYHMEAGNRCYDDRVPEEINRRVIDHCSSILMPYTSRSRDNLIAEGFPTHRLYVTGNPIKQVVDTFEDRIAASTVLDQLGLQEKRFFLVTAHRAENVDRQDRLRGIVAALNALQADYGLPVVVSVHPRTRARLDSLGLTAQDQRVHYLRPFGFFDFIRLERSAYCILSDSGTVQEEACILGVPNVTIRDVTERPETLDCGSNVLAGVDPKAIVSAVALVSNQVGRWQPPPEYLAPCVAETVVRILLSHRNPDAAEQNWHSAS